MAKQGKMAKIATGVKPQQYAIDLSAAPVSGVLAALGTSERGITEAEAASRLREYGYNEPAKKKEAGIAIQILSRFINPLVVVLCVIGGLSLYFGEAISAALVLAMIIISVVLGYLQEYRSGREVEKLMEMVKAKATVYRGGKPKEVPINTIVPGDVVDLFAGDIISADLRIISCKDLFINQSALTGESIPVEKNPSGPDNMAYMGSTVVSGTAMGVAVKTGLYTRFGEFSKRLAAGRGESSFDTGVKKFTWSMIQVMLVMVAVIFAINWGIKKEFLQALMFSLAVAVGLTPEMLPLIITINLSKGAVKMAGKKVIVKRLNSIQNLGAMDVLCTDKTGTITIDRVVLEKYCDVMRRDDADVLSMACVNSYYQSGLKNILDRAILKYVNKKGGVDITGYRKLDELPFDFSRRIMSVAIEMEGKTRLIAKGAPEEIFKKCAKYELDGAVLDLEYVMIADLKEEYDKLSSEGFRVLALAYRDFDGAKTNFTRDDEQGLVLRGYLAFLDPPKPSAEKAIKLLNHYGVRVKVLTGDNDLVAKKVCGEVGLDTEAVMTGEALDKLDDAALALLVEDVTVFARLSPSQKVRVVEALRKNGHITGFMGDGINDAAALRASDVGISVNNAVDIAKESADIILLEKKLSVLEDGVLEGRRTFGNIVKYIRMASSSNFGNMLSMTGASLFLPFLPMTPIQVLFNNFLYDISQTSIPTDEVDEEELVSPKPWDVGAIRKYMFFIGPVSSVFDFTTFAVLIFMFHCTAATQALFHTGWFIESLVTQTLAIYVIRTAKVPIVQSRPSRFMILTTLGVVAIGLAVPFFKFEHWFGFVTPPASYLLILEGIVAAYLVAVYYVQGWFFKKFGKA